MKAKTHTPTEKLHLRRTKRKTGPSAQRRQQKRAPLQTKKIEKEEEV